MFEKTRSSEHEIVRHASRLMHAAKVHNSTFSIRHWCSSVEIGSTGNYVPGRLSRASRL